ncbi:MAG TPA: DUF4126 domain-containing protein [Nocardioides sp.]|jgi:hypothetical protein|nr:DUF4126 domain-containing protein [uncultured Nocardioides sp.]HEX5986784.1 DUF4126 domain-containing protein [Nocardioides sp.]
MPLVASSGLASGVNAYLVVLVLGLADRFWQLAQVPDVLARTDVLVVAAVLYAVEFVADKIPYIDSTWDAISTAIRPSVGAVIGLLLAGDVSTLEQALYAVLGGGAALASHTVKAGLRLAVNTSPEPVTNATTSVGEDLGVATVVLLAVTYPWIALTVALVLFGVGVWLLVYLLTRIRRGWRRWRAWRENRVQQGVPRS